MNFKIYTLGHPLAKFYLDAIKEYEKRLSRYCKISHTHFKNLDALQKMLSPKTYVIALSIDSESLTSVEFAHKINTWGISGTSDITFIIGVNEFSAKELLCITPLQTDLGLCATLLVEQIYRGYRILNNQPYHK